MAPGEGDAVNFANMPGPGDEATWPPYSGHPNDPRAPDDSGRDEAIEERAQELLAGSEYGPYTPANLSEAMGEFDVTGIEALCKLLTAGNAAGAGLALKTLVFDYWERAARQEAERQIDEAAANACHRCRGRGCRHCDEDYHPRRDD